MGSKDPEPVVFPSVGMDNAPSVHVPDFDHLVFGVRGDDVHLRVEQRAADVMRVPAHRLNLPGLGFRVSPEAYGAVVSSGDHVGSVRVKTGPVDPAVVALERMLDDDVRAGENLRLASGASPGAAELLFEVLEIPDPRGLIERGRND